MELQKAATPRRAGWPCSLRAAPWMEGAPAQRDCRRRRLCALTSIPTGITRRSRAATFMPWSLSVGPTEAESRSASITARFVRADMAWTGHRSPAEILAAGDIVYVRVTAVEPEHTVATGAGAGLRRAGRAGGHRQQHRRNSRHGRRPRLRRIEIQSRHPGSAADRLILQALRLLGGRGAGRDAG